MDTKLRPQEPMVTIPIGMDCRELRYRIGYRVSFEDGWWYANEISKEFARQQEGE